ncbi:MULTISPECIES: hypothetical protein [Pseudomonas]|jgi:hypothetical protein|uniref:Uncharacterized protein n=1 Tax=Pseudomonas taiwanensis SJ9 TaxID=1388762 RepID=V7D880_9PSED|nr:MULTISPECIES: hypothetical protein [Pseudomonas]ESW38524.1 hypothetical protein O164_17450 [Pseudomonas taiwanensis SJ9]KAF4559187.1 hypothetical protein HBJ16_003189 [Pseudomonas sp. CES]KGK25576.1 hypothetical protein GT93_12350 [Pseudomonas plecoglossicida]MBO2889583.1 hypothetical protein [Pseudomonas asiatica]
MQTIFPYFLITRDEEVVAKAAEISLTGVEEARGIHAFLAEMKFDQVRDALVSTGKEVALIQAHELQYIHALGDLARLFGHLNRVPSR